VSQATGGFGKRLGLVRGMRVAVTAFALTMATMAIVMSLGFNPLPPAAFFFVGYGCLGHPDDGGSGRARTMAKIAGTASSMMVASIFFDGTAVPMAMGIALCAVAALLTFGGRVVRRSHALKLENSDPSVILLPE
jgi:DHA1 family bicyclomycin/chloramphenicol resistance-like MFS transporter